MYSSSRWELAARGISCLMLDQPGTGEALRLQGLTARIGISGWSLGGSYAPRAAAFEQRCALCVAWGANHDWGAVQRAAGWNGRASGPSRTTGSTSCGCGATPI
ncbi:alpha/beta hydrolase family protein [Nonomuraea wenchangensis]